MKTKVQAVEAMTNQTNTSARGNCREAGFMPQYTRLMRDVVPGRRNQ